MVFFGEYHVSFTAPGRLVLPKKIRELITGDSFIVTKGFDFCLSGYDRKDWEERAEALLKVSLLDGVERERRRMLFSSTAYVDIDKQSRFVLSKPLLQHAQLADSAVIVGVGEHFEIWNPERWEQYVMSHNTSMP